MAGSSYFFPGRMVVEDIARQNQIMEQSKQSKPIPSHDGDEQGANPTTPKVVVPGLAPKHLADNKEGIPVTFELLATIKAQIVGLANQLDEFGMFKEATKLDTILETLIHRAEKKR